MSWQLFAGTLGFLVLLAAVIVLLVRRRRSQPSMGLATESQPEAFLTEYFALDEFNDEELRQRLERMRSAPNVP